MYAWNMYAWNGSNAKMHMELCMKLHMLEDLQLIANDSLYVGTRARLEVATRHAGKLATAQLVSEGFAR